MRVLIADQDTQSAATLVHAVARMGGAATVRWELEKAWQALRASSFDVLVFDPGSEVATARDFLRRLRSAGPSSLPDARMRVLAVVGASASYTPAQMLQAGADQCAPKPLDVDLVAALLRSLVPTRGGPAAFKAAAASLQLDAQRGVLMRGKTPVQLTRTQAELLAVLALSAPRAVSRMELVASCAAATLSARALGVHVSQLRKHLGQHAIQTIQGGGFQLLAPVHIVVTADRHPDPTHQVSVARIARLGQ